MRPIRARHEADKAVAVLQFAGDAPTEIMSVDGAAMDKALSAMCRDMTVLAHGKLCLAGSYALHRQLCEQGDFERARWKPTDIDVFYCSSGSGLDGDGLRRRMSYLAQKCQLQMLAAAGISVADAPGDVEECPSIMYDAFSKRPYAPCLDDQDEARVAAFAREELMSICSPEPARSRRCATRSDRTRGRPWGDVLRRRAHPPSLCREHLGRYRIRSSVKLVHPATGDRWPPVFNLVEVEPTTNEHEIIMQNALLLGRSTSAAFADFIIRDFDMAVCQVAYYSGDDSRLLPVVSDAASKAIRDGELRLSGCAFQAADVRGTGRQLGRILKYVDRGFRLPSGPLAAAPRALLDEPSSTHLRVLVWRLLKGRLHWEPVTPPRGATPARRPHLLMLKFAITDGGQWHVVPPRSSAVAQQLAAAARDCAAPMVGLSRKLRNHAEALAVWTYAKKIKAEVYRTKLDMRSCVPQYNGWRVLGQLLRSGKGIDRFDLYILPPDMLPSLPLRALRPTNRAVRSFRGLHALLMQRFATTASGGGGAMTAARTSRRCPACCTLPCCRRASAAGAHADASAAGVHASSSDCAAPPLPPKKRYRDHAAARRDGRRVHDMQAVVPDGVVRDDMETAMARQERLRQALHMAAPPLRVQSAGSAGTCRVMRKQEESDETPVLKMSGDDDAQL